MSFTGRRSFAFLMSPRQREECTLHLMLSCPCLAIFFCCCWLLLIPLPLFCLLLITYDDYSTFTCVCAFLRSLFFLKRQQRTLCTCVSASRLFCTQNVHISFPCLLSPGPSFSFYAELRASLHYLLFTSSYIFRQQETGKHLQTQYTCCQEELRVK